MCAVVNAPWREEFIKVFRAAPSANVAFLTDKEAKAFNLLLDATPDKLYTQDMLGRDLGVSATRAKQLLESAAKKLQSTGPIQVTPAGQTKTPRPLQRTALSHQELMRLTLWANTAKDRLHELTLEAMIAVASKETGLAISPKTMASVCEALGILIRRKPKFFSESQVSRTLAKELVRLYTKLGETISDELWELAGGREDG